MSDKVQAPFHGGDIAGGVKHHVEEFAAGSVRQLLLVAVAQLHRAGDTERVAAELQTVGAAVEHRHVGAFQGREQHHGHADRTGAHHQHALAGIDRAALDGVRADGEKFDHGRVVERDAFRLEDEALGQRQVFRHAAVAVHAQHFDAGAAVGLALAAGHASTA
ncbi:hypothetical protein D3C81_1534580 [compost metagenome]